MNATQPSGLIAIPSNHSVDETVARITRMLSARVVKLFAVIDHSGEAETIGMAMPPTKLMIFGSPRAGTPLMLASPSVAIDLPLKLLIAEDSHGSVTISFNSPDYLRQRHNLPEDLMAALAVIKGLARSAAE